MTTQTLESLRLAVITAQECHQNALQDTVSLMRERESAVSPDFATTYAAANNLQFDQCGNIVAAQGGAA